jgi:hypothetical protein
MNNEEKYLSVLSAAIAQIENDSFEARGGVYDRLWKIILQRLQTGAGASDENIAREREAFLAAVKRIEFGERVPAARQWSDPPMPEKLPRPRVRRRIIGRMASASALLIVVGLVYFIARFDSVSAVRWVSENPQSSWQSHFMRAIISIHNRFERQSPAAQGPRERAVLYEESAATSTGSTYSGYAIWKRQSERKGAGAGFLSIDVEVPQKDLLLNVELRPAPDKGGAISHFVEFKFLTQNRTSSETVQDVLGILMKNDELSPGIELSGKVIRVGPGVFLMGLSGAGPDVERNLKLLRERPWLDIPIVFRGGPRSLLAIEKGTTGQNAINEVLGAVGPSSLK